MAYPDVVIIGGGVIGCATAYELSKAGLKVAVVERGQPGCEASGAAAGMLVGESVGGRDEPFAVLAQTSRDLYAPLAEELREVSGVDIERQTTGHLHLLSSQTDLEKARALPGVELLSPDEVHRLEPAVSHQISGAILFRGNHWVNNQRLVSALVQASARRGVEYHLGSEVTEVTLEKNGVTGVRGRNLTIRAGTVIVTAGAWSGMIGGLSPCLTVEPVKGQMLSVETVPAVIHHCVYLNEVYMVPRPSGELLIGATVEHVGYDKHVTPEGLQRLLSEALAAVPALAQRPIVRSWAGIRPASSDGLPIIGAWPGLDRCFVATGHFRNGILLAPITAQLMRELIIDGVPSLSLAPFRPDRFLT